MLFWPVRTSCLPSGSRSGPTAAGLPLWQGSTPGPRTDKEWDEIEHEISSIQRLTPGNWYGEYLQNRVAEARRGGRSAPRSGRLVVRGSAPDENPPAGETPSVPVAAALRPRHHASGTPASPAPAEEPLGLPSLPGAHDAQPLPAATAPGPDSGSAETPAPEPRSQGAGGEAERPAHDANGASRADGRSSQPLAWHVLETANFRIYHTDAVLAARAGQAAEAVRSQQARRWGSSATRSTWSPRCDIYLYPTPRDFALMTGQPETSPGFSTMGINGNRITARRVNLRVDHPQLIDAILPHEVTHVVLADLFTQQQIPRWADEGMAVLSEPLSEQLGRAADLAGPLADGRVFKLNELMAIDYPSADAWGLYYAQSVSLTQFLVEQGTPEQFISFVRARSARESSNRFARSTTSPDSPSWRTAGRPSLVARVPPSPLRIATRRPIPSRRAVSSSPLPARRWAHRPGSSTAVVRLR